MELLKETTYNCYVYNGIAQVPPTILIHFLSPSKIGLMFISAIPYTVPKYISGGPMMHFEKSLRQWILVGNTRCPFFTVKLIIRVYQPTIISEIKLILGTFAMQTHLDLTFFWKFLISKLPSLEDHK